MPSWLDALCCLCALFSIGALRGAVVAVRRICGMSPILSLLRGHLCCTTTYTQDPDQNVRGGAAFAIGQMSEFMAYEVVSLTAQLGTCAGDGKLPFSVPFLTPHTRASTNACEVCP